MIKKCEKIFTAPVGSAISELVSKPQRILRNNSLEIFNKMQ
ncbi:SLEI domain protein, PF07620 family [Leptospira interrogans str. L1207]|nr:SLEI domain protein, PF07620 family [Leptospira interrogans str. L1207]EMN50051.1 SLEI domain protein, PF07620 family [Leptospira interrogans str. L1207]